MKNDLREHYWQLYNSSIEQLKNNHYYIDTNIHSAKSNRFGLTLLIRPSMAVKDKIQDFFSQLKKDNPNQYFYPCTDIHITVLSLISCYDGFDYKNISISDYCQLIQKSLENIEQFEIQFQGISASDSAILIQGFPMGNNLEQIRNNLRAHFLNSSLERSIDKRYVLKTAHATVVRYSDTIINKESLIDTLEAYRNYDFGKFHVKELELVYNDWYHREALVQKIDLFPLK